MGMFDYVEIAVGKLPLSPEERKKMRGHDWQTKDFDCTLTTIRITDEDTLEIRRFEHEFVPKEERPYPNDNGLLGIVGSMREINTRWEKIEYHGWFSFYGSEGGIWYEFAVKCTDGKVVQIDKISPTTTIPVEPEVKRIS